MMKNKKGALELSVGTIVIIVIAMSMLILGLVLVRTIFTAASESVDQLNDVVREQISETFRDTDKRIAMSLTNRQANVQKEETFGIAFGIRNTETGVAEAGQFTWTVRATEVQSRCSLSLERADSYITLNKEGGPISILPGAGVELVLIKITPDSSAPLCEIQYDINVRKDGQHYAREFFVVRVEPS